MREGVPLYEGRAGVFLSPWLGPTAPLPSVQVPAAALGGTTMNSFRKIPTPLYRALTKADFTKAEYKTILVIMDFTLGYNQRLEASISFSTFEKLTGLARSTVNEAVRSLKNAKVISVSYQGNNHHKEPVYTFNYQYETWGTGSNCVPVSSSENLPDTWSETLPV